MSGGYTPSGPARRTDGLAIASLIIGILSLACFVVCLGIILGPTAAIMGFIARQRISSSGGTVGGGTMATIGLILGVIGFIISVGWFFLFLTGVITSSTFSSPTP